MVRTILGVAAVALTVAVAPVAATGAPHERPGPDGATRLGPAKGATTSVALLLRTDEAKVARHHARRAARAAAGNPLPVLSARDATRRFGAPTRSVHAVQRWARSHGLRAKVGRLRTHVEVTGTGAALSDALDVPLHRYRHPHEPTYVASHTAPRVPRRLRRHVTAVAGLEHVRPRPPSPRPPIGPGSIDAGAGLGGASFDCKTQDFFTASGGATPMTPLGLASAYGMDQVGTASDAPPQTIAVLQIDNVPVQGLYESYAQACRFGDGPAPPVRVTSIDGAIGNKGGPYSEWFEATMDVQVVGSIAPANTQIAFVNGSWQDPMRWLHLFEQVVAVAQANALDAPLTVATISFSDAERCESAAGCPVPPATAAANRVLSRLGAMGVTTVASSGDWGSLGAPTNLSTSWACYFDVPTGQPSVIYPASSPWATGVGGTQWPSATLPLGTTWAEATFDPPNCGNSASSGGQSGLFPTPGWQRSATTNAYRSVPDLALLAGPPGMVHTATGTVFGSGGTSASTPLLAAGIARLNADRLAARKQPLGFLNPAMYALPAGAFSDVRTGDNDLWNVGCCGAGPGYDMTTGLGAPLFTQTAWSAIP